MGLSSTQYNGHVFWDADIWVFPALALINPSLARQIPDYRLATVPQARRNFDEWIKAGRPTGQGNVSQGEGEGPGVKYAWESSVTGKETVPGPSRFQDHITGSVLWGLDQATALGLADPAKVNQTGREAGAFFLARSELNKDGWREIKGTMSPDEHHTGDNDLYTNLLAEWTLTRFYPEQDWSFKGFKRPQDEKGFLTYDNDALKAYKQAAAVLAIYPLQHPEAVKQARTMMERFEEKVTENGPAMTDSVHATIWARLGESDKAYAAWHESWQPFTKHPLLLFSEKRRKPVTYFITGAGGSLQSVIYGFLGFGLDSSKEPKAAWSLQLDEERWLNVRPNLPKAWKSVKLRNFTVKGRRYTLTATQERATVSQGE
jgi:trehalose/maltose hydrolase-like predicted phosphorylase